MRRVWTARSTGPAPTGELPALTENTSPVCVVMKKMELRVEQTYPCSNTTTSVFILLPRNKQRDRTTRILLRVSTWCHCCTSASNNEAQKSQRWWKKQFFHLVEVKQPTNRNSGQKVFLRLFPPRGHVRRAHQ